MELGSLVEVKSNPHVPQIRPGDIVRVSVKVVEGDRERVQNFQGLVIRMRRGGIASNFTVRRVAYGVGVERTFFLSSPRLEKVEVLRHGKVRRANLYYLRKLSGKAAQLKERRGLKDLDVKAEEEVAEAEAPLEAKSASEILTGSTVAEAPVAEAKPVAEKPAAEAKPAKKKAAEPKAAETTAEAKPAKKKAAEPKAATETSAEPNAAAEAAPESKTEQPKAVKEAPDGEKSA